MEGPGGRLLSAPPARSRQVFPEFGRKPCSWRERAAHEAASLEPGQPGTCVHTCACTHMRTCTDIHKPTYTLMHMYTHARTRVNTPGRVQLAVTFLRAPSASATVSGAQVCCVSGPLLCSPCPARASAGTPGPRGLLWSLHSTVHVCQPSPRPPYPISFMPTSAVNFLSKV